MAAVGPPARRDGRPGHHELPDLAGRDEPASTPSPCPTSRRPTSSTSRTTVPRARACSSSSGDEHGRWPAVLDDPAAPGAACFRELDLGPPRRPVATDPLGGRPAPSRSSVHERRPVYSEGAWRQHAPGRMTATAASTDSTRRRPPRSAPARTRCAASASATARPTAPSSSARRGRATARSTEELGDRQAELTKLELAQHTLERTWLFLERGDVTLVTEAGGPPTSGDIAMRIVEAQEAERSRLAQEIHDGPAQALTNAIFQVEYIERVIDHRPARSPRPSCASCASCSAASSATSARSSASSARRCSTSSGSTARSSTPSSGSGRSPG